MLTMEIKPPPWKDVCQEVTKNGLLVLSDASFNALLNRKPIDTVYIVEQSPFARGKFASVRKATHRETGIHYAAKVIRRRRRVQDLTSEILHEVAVLALSTHTNIEKIVKMKEVFETPLEITLILELAEGGELQRVIDEELNVTESEAIVILRHIVEGLAFLHSRNVAHLDVKQNIMPRANPTNHVTEMRSYHAYYVPEHAGGNSSLDFMKDVSRSYLVTVKEYEGVSEEPSNPESANLSWNLSTFALSLQLPSPEVLNYEPITLATDIWSVGVLAYVLLSGCTPFGGDSKQETFCNIGQGELDFPEELFEHVSDTAIDFMRKTIHIDPKERMSAISCLEHKWLSGDLPRTLPENSQETVPVMVTGVEAMYSTTAETVTVKAGNTAIHANTASSTVEVTVEKQVATEETTDSAQIHNESVASDDGLDSGVETLSDGSDNATGPNNGRCDLGLIPESKTISGEAQVHRMTTGRVTKLVGLWENVGHGARRPSEEMSKENVVSPPPPAKRREKL